MPPDCDVAANSQHNQGSEGIEEIAQRREEEFHPIGSHAKSKSLIDEALELAGSAPVAAVGTVQANDQVAGLPDDLCVGDGVAIDSMLASAER